MNGAMAGDTKGAGHLLLTLSSLLLPLFSFPYFPLFKGGDSKHGLPLFTITNQRSCRYLKPAMRGSMAEEHASPMHSCESLVSSHFTQSALTLGWV